jgi:hypothetical protein
LNETTAVRTGGCIFLIPENVTELLEERGKGGNICTDVLEQTIDLVGFNKKQKETHDAIPRIVQPEAQLPKARRK